MDLHKIKFPYKWLLKDGYKLKRNVNVFGTFICAGGSTMGYKLAGFNHIGGVEFTEHYAKLYKKNHNPKHFYLEDVRKFNQRKDLPDDLYNLDMLDGSPPCSSFSTSGARARLWGKEKKYEDKVQKTDDLVFEYIKTIDKLKPKAFLMENVSGLIKGNAKGYVLQLAKQIKEIGYSFQVFLLNAASMGVPQMRERVFIIGNNRNYKKLKLSFNEKPISFQEATKEYWGIHQYSLEGYQTGKFWDSIKPGESHHRRFSLRKPHLNRPCFTLIESMCKVSTGSVVHPIHKRKLNDKEASAVQSFPMDFDFMDQPPLSCIGRSVPPVMMAQIANQIYLQWFKNA